MVPPWAPSLEGSATGKDLLNSECLPRPRPADRLGRQLLVERLLPEPGTLVRRQLVEGQPEDVLERCGELRADLVDGHRPAELAGDRRERRPVEPAGRDPFGER